MVARRRNWCNGLFINSCGSPRWHTKIGGCLTKKAWLPCLMKKWREYDTRSMREDWYAKQNDQERHSLEMGWDGTGPTSDRWPMPREIYMSSTRWVVCLVNQPAEAAAVGDVMGAQNYRAYFVRNVTSDDRNGWLLSSLVAEAENHRRRRYGMAGEDDGWNLIREEWMKCENDHRSRLVSSLALTFLFAPRGW